MEAAKNAIQAQKDQEALQLLTNFVSQNPRAAESIEARFLIAQIQFRQNQFDQAIRSFQSVISVGRNTEWAAKAWGEIAKVHENRRNPSAAQQAREALLNDYPKSSVTGSVWMAIANRHFLAGEFKSAVAIYDKIASHIKGADQQRYEAAKAIVDSGGAPERIMVVANQALKDNRREFAKGLYEQVIQKNAQADITAEARTKFAWCIYLKGGQDNLEAAEKIWKSIASREPKSQWGGTSRWHLVQLHAGPKREWQTAVEMCAAIARDFPQVIFATSKPYTHVLGCYARTSSGKTPKRRLRSF